MIRVDCKDCRYFRQAPYEAPRTGCWHPDHMEVAQKEPYLDQQQQPGDHRRINARGDCASFEARPPKPSFWKRLMNLGA